MNQDQFAALIDCFDHCNAIDKKIRDEAEHALEDSQETEGFTIMLLNILGIETVSKQIRYQIAIYFKNCVKKFWKQSNDHYTIPESEKLQIRNSIINAVVSSDDYISKLLSDSISIIAEEDFPQRWESVYSQLLEKVDSGNIISLRRILECANNIIRHYSGKAEVDENLYPVRLCLDQFGIHLFDIWKALNSIIDDTRDPSMLGILLDCLSYIASIYSSLCWFDLPDIFEDQLEEWMNEFIKYLSRDFDIIESGYEEGPVERLKASIIEIMSTIESRNNLLFLPYAKTITEKVWNILSDAKYKEEDRYNTIYKNGLTYLASMSKLPSNQSLFTGESLQIIIQNIIIPCLLFTDDDMNNYEDMPYEYIQNELEDANGNSRKRACHDVLYSMRQFYNEQLIMISMQTMSPFLALSNPSQWREKEACLSLFMYISSGFQTAMQGIKDYNKDVNINEFFTLYIIPELAKADGTCPPVLLTRCLYLCLLYRNVLDTSLLNPIFSYLLNILQFTSPSNHLLAAITIEKYLSIKNLQNRSQSFFSSSSFSSLSTTVNTLCCYIQEGNASLMHQYYLRTLTAIVTICKEQFLPLLPATVSILSTAVSASAAISDSPNPVYTHYLFECIGALMRITISINPTMLNTFEDYFIQPFTNMIQDANNDCVSYVIQILSYMFELHGTTSVNEQYALILPVLLAEPLWNVNGNVTPLIRFIRAYCRYMPSLITANILSILTLFRNLIGKAATRWDGFDLLEGIVFFLPLDSYKQYLTTIWQILITLSQKLSILRGRFYIIYIFALFSALYGPEYASILLRNNHGEEKFLAFLKTVSKGIIYPSSPTQHKILVAGLCRVFLEDPQMKSITAGDTVCFSLTALLCSISSSVGIQSSLDQEETQDDFEAQRSFTSYHGLKSISIPDYDPIPAIIDYQSYFRDCYKTFNSAYSECCSTYLQDVSFNSYNRENMEYITNYNLM
ncbi:hypothetical protein WA158_004769 [Blastocystis sp. Blastoise]